MSDINFKNEGKSVVLRKNKYCVLHDDNFTDEELKMAEELPILKSAVYTEANNRELYHVYGCSGHNGENLIKDIVKKFGLSYGIEQMVKNKDLVRLYVLAIRKKDFDLLGDVLKSILRYNFDKIQELDSFYADYLRLCDISFYFRGVGNKEEERIKREKSKLEYPYGDPLLYGLKFYSYSSDPEEQEKFEKQRKSNLRMDRCVIAKKVEHETDQYEKINFNISGYNMRRLFVCTFGANFVSEIQSSIEKAIEMFYCTSIDKLKFLSRLDEFEIDSYINKKNFSIDYSDESLISLATILGFENAYFNIMDLKELSDRKQEESKPLR